MTPLRRESLRRSDSESGARVAATPPDAPGVLDAAAAGGAAHWSYGEKPEVFGAEGGHKAGKTAAEGVQNVRRAVTLLNVLGQLRRDRSLCGQDLATCKLHKATAHRILGALLSEGLVEQDSVSRNYRLGARIWCSTP